MSRHSASSPLLPLSSCTRGEDKDAVENPETRLLLLIISSISRGPREGCLCLITQNHLGPSRHTGHRYRGRARAHTQPFEQFAFLASNVGGEWIHRELYAERTNGGRDKAKQRTLCHKVWNKVKWVHFWLENKTRWETMKRKHTLCLIVNEQISRLWNIRIIACCVVLLCIYHLCK